MVEEKNILANKDDCTYKESKQIGLPKFLLIDALPLAHARCPLTVFLNSTL